MNTATRLSTPVAAAAMAAIAAQGALADDSPPALDARRVEALVPGAKVSSVQPVPITGGLYEIIDEGGTVFYMDGAGRIGFQSDLFDVATRRNLTQESLARHRVVEFEDLPFDLAIKRVRGDGSRRMAVFADPDCPFCVKLEQELAGIDDLTVYVFLYPIAELHPAAPARAKEIWCASDRDAAWLGWVLRQQAPASGQDCATPLDQIAAIAPKFWVSGTPSLVFASGRVVTGFVPKAALEQYLVEAPMVQTAGTRPGR